MNAAPPTTADAFVPPTADQVAEHLASHAPRPRPAWLRFVPVGVVAAAVVVSLGAATWWAALVPWIALAGVVATGVVLRKRHAALLTLTQYTQELAMLRYHREALRSTWTLLPRLKSLPDEHSRTVATIGHLLEDLGQHDAANAAFEHLLAGLPDNHPGAVSLQIQQAIASFESDHLADGDAQLRKVRNAIGPFEEGPLGAAYQTARLVQSVVTHHFAEGVEEVSDPVERFRPMGVDAGVGHALLAYCLHKLGRVDEALTSWRRATLLLPAEELCRRLPALNEMRGVAT